MLQLERCNHCEDLDQQVVKRKPQRLKVNVQMENQFSIQYNDLNHLKFLKLVLTKAMCLQKSFLQNKCPTTCIHAL